MYQRCKTGKAVDVPALPHTGLNHHWTIKSILLLFITAQRDTITNGSVLRPAETTAVDIIIFTTSELISHRHYLTLLPTNHSSDVWLFCKHTSTLLTT